MGGDGKPTTPNSMGILGTLGVVIHVDRRVYFDGTMGPKDLPTNQVLASVPNGHRR